MKDGKAVDREGKSEDLPDVPGVCVVDGPFAHSDHMDNKGYPGSVIHRSGFFLP